MKDIYPVPEYVFNTYIPEHIGKLIKPMKSKNSYKYQPDGGHICDMAKAQGCVNFDTALPLDWVRDFENKTGFSPVGNFVYDYTEEPFGKPSPVTSEGQVAYQIYLHICGMRYGDPATSLLQDVAEMEA
jgi:hypothetical protein